MDHAPGPIMAAVAPRIASMIGTQGSPTWVIAIHSSMAAIKVPTTGVQRPMKRSMPAHIPATCGIIDAEIGVPASWRMPYRTSIVPVRTRWSSRPTPGQPLAKVEKSRCKNAPDKIVRQLRRDSKHLKVGVGYPAFGGRSKAKMPRCRPIVTAWERSLAPSLDNMLDTWLFTVASPIES